MIAGDDELVPVAERPAMQTLRDEPDVRRKIAVFAEDLATPSGLSELRFDPLVGATGITAKNLNGDVALTGTVTSYPQYLQAATAAKRVQSVSRVHNHLVVELPFPTTGMTRC